MSSLPTPSDLPEGPDAGSSLRDQIAEACAFCDIVNGTGPVTMVREWDDAIAFVPLGPVVDGHVLVVPRQHVANAVEDPAVTTATMVRAIELAAEHPAANILTSIGKAATQSIFHLHIHVIRREPGDQLMVPWGTTGDPQLPHSCKRSELAETRLDAKDAENERLTEQLRLANIDALNTTAELEQAEGSLDDAQVRLTDAQMELEQAEAERATAETWRVRNLEAMQNAIQVMNKAAAERDRYREAIERVRAEMEGIKREARQALSEGHPAGTARSRADGMARAANRALAALDQPVASPFATGGLVPGPATPDSDSIPAILSGSGCVQLRPGETLSEATARLNAREDLDPCPAHDQPAATTTEET